MSTPFDFITGYYLLKGSNDYPLSFSPNDKYGFNLEDGTTVGPIFNFSYADVINGFSKPVELTVPTTYSNGSINDFNSIIIENPLEDEKLSVNPEDPAWNTMIRILEYIYVNQDIVTVQMVKDEFIGVSQLIDSTLTITRNQTMTERIDFVSFAVDFNPSLTDQDRVDFKFYINPDVFMRQESINKYKVYFYNDLDGDDLISKEEWRSQIISKHLEIMKDSRYKFVKELTTPYVENQTQTDHTFYIYTVFEDFSNTMIEDVVREYLLSKHTLSWCIVHYPGLFSGSTVNIYPIENRNISTALINPISYSKLKDALTFRGYNGTLQNPKNNVKNLEIFYVGNESTTPNPVPVPLIAVDSVEDSIIRPVSSSFPSYIPTFVPFPGFMEEKDLTVRVKTFHHMIFLASSIMLGFQDPSAIVSVDDFETSTNGLEIPKEYNFTVNFDDSSALESVSFRLGGVLYVVHGF